MPKPGKSESPPKQGPPVAFRAGPDLSRLVAGYAAGWGVGVHEAFKNLAALAAVGLDIRYYDLVAASAAGSGGGNAFVRAVLRISAGLTSRRRRRPEVRPRPGPDALAGAHGLGSTRRGGGRPPYRGRPRTPGAGRRRSPSQ